MTNPTEFALYGTEKAQMFSLFSFMRTLNYALVETPHGGYVFVTSERKCPRRNISFNSAVRLHNADFMAVGDCHYVSNAKGQVLVTDAYTTVQAIASKVVQKVKFQYNKKTKKITLQHENANLVRWCMPEFAIMFGQSDSTDDEA